MVLEISYSLQFVENLEAILRPAEQAPPFGMSSAGEP